MALAGREGAVVLATFDAHSDADTRGEEKQRCRLVVRERAVSVGFFAAHLPRVLAAVRTDDIEVIRAALTRNLHHGTRS